MNKYLLPWEVNKQNGEERIYYYRNNLSGKIIAAIARQIDAKDKKIWRGAIGKHRNKINDYENLEEAFKDIDSKLIERGFKLNDKLSIML